MSVLEPLVALSLACNVMQIITFGRDIISLCKRIYQSGTPEPSLVKNSERLAALSHNLSAQLSTQRPLRKIDQDVLDIAQKSAAAASDLREELNFLAANGAGLCAVVLALARTAWRRRRLDRLEKTLADMQRILETTILIRLSAMTDTLQIQQEEAFTKLDADVKYFIQQLSDGHTSLSQLTIRQSGDVKAHVTSHASVVKDHITVEASRVDISVKSHMTKELVIRQRLTEEHIASASTNAQKAVESEMHRLHLARDDQRARERFLESLKYPDMNARKNQIKESFSRTFAWIFKDDSVKVAAPSSEWPSFVKFLQSDEKLYWISGKPGSGKSTLMKFIISQQETLNALERWRAGTHLLSHFLWSPGQSMQRSIKGTLCSLLYQICQTTEGCAEALLQSHQDLRLKDSPSDWATAELRELVLRFFRASTTPYCIFLDGLDEVCPEDGVGDILDFVQELQSLSQLKLCIASRPEHVFKRRLAIFPRLEVQQLTANDLSLYAKSLLSRADIQEAVKDAYDRLIIELLYKAQGVFLWLALAVKSLRRGIDNKDSLQQLQKRLDTMPDDLATLYEDMWLRLNEDRMIYRQTASLYFQLVLAARDCTLISEPSVFELAVAADDDIQAALGPEQRLGSLSPNALERSCRATINDVEVRCAGLLEITVGYDDPWKPPGIYTTLLPYKSLKIDFIHRTAYDFLLTTADGQAILLSRSLLPPPSVRLFRGCLSNCLLPNRRDRMIELETPPVKPFFEYLKQLQGQNKINEADTIDSLLRCRVLYDARCLTFYINEPRTEKNRSCGPNFLGLAAAYGFGSAVLSILQNSMGHQTWNPEFLSYLLHKACHFNYGHSLDRCRLIQFLLKMGANPDYRGHTFSNSLAMGPLSCIGLAFCSIFHGPWRGVVGPRGSDQQEGKALLGMLQHCLEIGVDLKSQALVAVIGDVEDSSLAYSLEMMGDVAGHSRCNVWDKTHRAAGLLLEVDLSTFLDMFLCRLPRSCQLDALDILCEGTSFSPRVCYVRAFRASNNRYYVTTSAEDSAYLISIIHPWLFGRDDGSLRNERDGEGLPLSKLDQGRIATRLYEATLELMSQSQPLDNTEDYMKGLGYLHTTRKDLYASDMLQFL